MMKFFTAEIGSEPIVSFLARDLEHANQLFFGGSREDILLQIIGASRADGTALYKGSDAERIIRPATLEESNRWLAEVRADPATASYDFLCWLVASP